MDNSEADKYSYRKLYEQIHKAYNVDGKDDENHGRLYLVKSDVEARVAEKEAGKLCLKVQGNE